MDARWIAIWMIVPGCLRGAETTQSPPCDEVGVWYADTDRDGFGDPDAPRCPADPGAVNNNEDCDDSDEGVSPGAPEICASGIPRDDDCDPTTDDPVASVGNVPFANIDDAVSAALRDGGEVLLCDGEYKFSSPIVVEGTLGIRSASDDPQITILKANRSALFQLEGPTTQLTLTGLTLSGGSGDRGGAVSGSAKGGGLTGLVVLRNIEAVDNRALDGGVVAADRVVVEDSVLRENAASTKKGFFGRGGAVFANTITSHRSRFENNGSIDGGALYSLDNTTSVDGTYTGNTASRTAGAVLAKGGMVSTADHFRENTSITAGAVQVEAPSRFEGTTFEDNSAAQSGGAVAAFNAALDPKASLALLDCRFTNNRAETSGGAALVQRFVHVDATKTIFMSNSAAHPHGEDAIGGGVFLAPHDPAGVQWHGAEFQSNDATSQGGGIYLNCDATDMPATFQDTLLSSNLAAQGAGIYVSPLCAATMDRLSFHTNMATLEGGGLQLAGDSSADMSSPEFLGNTAIMGSAILTEGRTTLTISAGILNNNRSSGDYGAIQLIDIPVAAGTVTVLDSDVGVTESTDNTPFDVGHDATSSPKPGWGYSNSEPDASFICDATNCRLPVRD